MSYIPDTRDAIENPLGMDGKDKPNPYYEGLLSDEDKREMDLYDYAVSDCANAFDNFDAAFEMAERILNDELPEDEDFIFTEEEEEFLMSDKVVRFIKIAMLCYAEGQRDEMVIAKIDNSNEADHQKKFEALEKDFKEMSKDDFYKKYPYREYNEYGNYD